MTELEILTLTEDQRVTSPRRCSLCKVGKLREGDVIIMTCVEGNHWSTRAVHKRCLLEKILSGEEMEAINGRP